MLGMKERVEDRIGSSQWEAMKEILLSYKIIGQMDVDRSSTVILLPLRQDRPRDNLNRKLSWYIIEGTV